MNKETKIYSDFIKNHNIEVGKDYFIFNGDKINLYKDNGKWYADNDDKSQTKKSAIYWYIKNRI